MKKLFFAQKTVTENLPGRYLPVQANDTGNEEPVELNDPVRLRVSLLQHDWQTVLPLPVLC